MNYVSGCHAPVRRVHVTTVENGLQPAIDLFRRQIAQRCSCAVSQHQGEYPLTLSLDPVMATDSYTIQDEGSGVLITGQSLRAVVYGLGKFLRTSGYSIDGFHPSAWRGTSAPTSLFRGIQLDTHWCNFYHTAPAHALQEYVEDLILWGINYIEFVFPLIDLHGWEDPEVENITGQICTIYRAAKALEVKVGMEVVPNQDFVDQNMDIQSTPCPGRPGGKTGHNICPNLPGALEYICHHTHGRTFSHLKERGVNLDFLCFWPYDEGGCGCDACAPWGANGYLTASKAVLKVAKSYFPEISVILSTWMFDTTYHAEATHAEWEGLFQSLEADSSWVDFLMADARKDFPRYPLTHPIPGGLPLLNYPEISMYKLWPWGGFGANPLPDHFQTLWNQVKDTVQGGLAYSEGIFNDINKILVSQFYWNKHSTADDILKEYIGYEFGPQVYHRVRSAIRLIEVNHEVASLGHNASGRTAAAEPVPEYARQARLLLQEADEQMDAWARKSWRWRLLLIRAELDLLRYTRAREQAASPTGLQGSWSDVLRGCKDAKPWLTELMQILHSNLDFNAQTHPHYRNVRPPLLETDNKEI